MNSTAIVRLTFTTGVDMKVRPSLTGSEVWESSRFDLGLTSSGSLKMTACVVLRPFTHIRGRTWSSTDVMKSLRLASQFTL